MNSDPASLQNLNDIMAPGPLPWWPPAPGWYAVAAVVFVLAVWAIVRFLSKWRANAYRREALRHCAAIQSSGDEQLRQLPTVLKRTALSAWPRKQVASLSGREWHVFLDRTASTNLFTDGAGALLDRLAYPGKSEKPLTAEELSRLFEACFFWLRHHQAQVS